MPHSFRVLRKKLQPSAISAALLNKRCKSTGGIVYSSSTINISLINLCLTVSCKPYTTALISSIVKLILSTYILSPYHDTRASPFVIYRIFIPYVRICKILSIGLGFPPYETNVINRWTKSRTVSKTNGTSSFVISSLKPSTIYLRIVFCRWLYAVYTTIARTIVTIADNFGVKFSAGAYPLLSVSNLNTAIPLIMALLYSESPNSWSNMVI